MSQLRRQEINSSRQAKLADKLDELRANKRRICNVIHHSTWVAESSTILSCAIIQILTLNIDPFLANCISDTLSALIFGRIIAPFAHLFNEHRIKIFVLRDGWFSAMKHALKFNVTTDEPQPDDTQRKSQKNVALTQNIKLRRSDARRKVLPEPDRVDIFSIKINKRIEERPKNKLVNEITIPCHLSTDINILPNAVPSW